MPYYGLEGFGMGSYTIRIKRGDDEAAVSVFSGVASITAHDSQDRNPPHIATINNMGYWNTYLFGSSTNGKN